MSVDGYNLYRGEAFPTAINYAAPVAFVAAGTHSIVLDPSGLTPGTVYYFALRAVSAAGVEEANTNKIVRVVVDAEGVLASAVPPAIAAASALALAAGKVQVRAKTLAVGRTVGVCTLQLAQLVGGVFAWASPLATASIPVGRPMLVTMAPSATFADGATVRLALRLVNADGVAGPVMALPPLVARSAAPAGGDLPAAPTLEVL